MLRRRFFYCLASILSAGVIAGCQQPAGDMEHKGPPPRPAELDKLNPWVGTWNGSGDITVYTPKGPKTMKTTGTEHWAWACDNRFLMANFEWSMGDNANEKHQGIAMMTWNPKEKEFRSWEFMGDGTVNRGEMKYDEKAGLWRMEGKGTDPMTGQPTRGGGTAKMVGDKTMEWSFTMWDCLKLSKKMEGKGTSTKQ